MDHAFAAWLDARDTDALRTAWTALAPTRHVLGRPGWYLNGHGAACLASALLGWPIERVAWLAGDADERDLVEPSFWIHRDVTSSFLDAAIDVRERCTENWKLREVTDGVRGVQFIEAGFGIDDGSRDGTGGGAYVIRIFDRGRQRAASVFVSSQIASTIGDVDLAPLEVFEHTRSFRIPAWKRHDLANARGLLAQLAAEVDAHYDTSAAWPGGETSAREVVGPRSEPMTLADHHFADGARAVAIFEQRGAPDAGRASASLEGLPWGHAIAVHLDTRPTGTFGHVRVTLPLALGDRVLARLAATPAIELV